MWHAKLEKRGAPGLFIYGKRGPNRTFFYFPERVHRSVWGCVQYCGVSQCTFLSFFFLWSGRGALSRICLWPESKPAAVAERSLQPSEACRLWPSLLHAAACWLHRHHQQPAAGGRSGRAPPQCRPRLLCPCRRGAGTAALVAHAHRRREPLVRQWE
eukprot:COSAG01_NODE_36917_length_510_cov_68.902676_1_plen_156_part_10